MTFEIYVLALRGRYSTCHYYRSYQKRQSRFEPCWVDDIKKATIWTNKTHAKSALKNMLNRKAIPPEQIRDLSICRFTAVYQSEDDE